MNELILTIMLLATRVVIEQTYSSHKEQSGHKITLGWDASSKIISAFNGVVIRRVDANVTGYNVFVYTNNPDFQGARTAPIAEYWVERNQCTVTNLQVGKTYWFTVRAVNRFGFESVNSTSFNYTVP